MAKRLMTHMPFLEIIDGRETLFLCACPENSVQWNTGLWRDDDFVRIPTGLPDETTECGPVVWQDGQGIHLTFIAGNGPTRDLIPYTLYRLDSDSMADLLAGRSQRTRIRQARSGFIAGNRDCWCKLYKDKADIFYQDGDLDLTLRLDQTFIFRLSYIPDNPDIILITGKHKDRGIYSQTYNIRTGEQLEIICDGEPGYKCAILGDKVLYAWRKGDHVDDREVIQAKTVEYVPCDYVTLLAPS